MFKYSEKHMYSAEDIVGKTKGASKTNTKTKGLMGLLQTI